MRGEGGRKKERLREHTIYIRVEQLHNKHPDDCRVTTTELGGQIEKMRSLSPTTVVIQPMLFGHHRSRFDENINSLCFLSVSHFVYSIKMKSEPTSKNSRSAARHNLTAHFDHSPFGTALHQHHTLARGIDLCVVRLYRQNHCV